MPTPMTHLAIPLAVGLGLGSVRIPPALLWSGMGVALLPDADLFGMGFGIPYLSLYGHRGISHSLPAAALVALAVVLLLRLLGERRFWGPWLYLFLCGASHGLLDAFTNGGLGIALLWPLSEQRLFVPLAWRVIEVTPIGIERFFTQRGVTVIASELLWVWLPALGLGVVLALLGRPRAAR